MSHMNPLNNLLEGGGDIINGSFKTISLMFQLITIDPKASVSETWGIREDCGLFFPIDSEMAGPIGLKLGGLVEGMGEIVLAKEFF